MRSNIGGSTYLELSPHSHDMLADIYHISSFLICICATSRNKVKPEIIKLNLILRLEIFSLVFSM